MKPDFEWPIIDASHCKVHPHTADATGGNETMSRTKGGSTQKIHLAVDAQSMPLRVVVTEGIQADGKEACALIDGVNTGAFLADRDHDTDDIHRKTGESSFQIVIPPKKIRKILRNYDKELYKVRHLIENAFLHLKRLRRITTRYSKKCPLFFPPFKSDVYLCDKTI